MLSAGRRIVMRCSEPKGGGWGWGVTQHVCPSVCVYLYMLLLSLKKQPVVSNILYTPTPERDGKSTRVTDSTTNWLPDWLIDWFDCFLSLSGGGSAGSGVEGVLKCFIESGLIDSTANSYRWRFPLLPARSGWALWAHMLACWMGANNISDALAYARTGLWLHSHLFSTGSMHLSHHENRFWCMQRDILTFQFSFVFNINIFWLAISCYLL